MADRDCTVAGVPAVKRGISKLTERKQSEKGQRDFICLHLFLDLGSVPIYEDGASAEDACRDRWTEQVLS